MAGSGPVSIVSGSFNSTFDSIPDLAIANQLSNTITILPGTGLGTFNSSASPATLTVANPGAMATADFNGDGNADLAVANVLGGTVTVLLGNGTGGFAPSPGSPFNVGTTPSAIAINDFNGDGIPDLAVTNLDSGNVSVLLGDGKGNFSPAPLSPYAVPHTMPNANGGHPSSVATADFNGDGMPDLAVTNETDNSIVILLNKGALGFVPTPLSPIRLNPSPMAVVNPASIVTADFNDDQIPDLAVANLGNNAVSILFGAGNGVFMLSPTAITVGTQPINLVTADFNGDTYPDLAVANAGSDSVTVLLGNVMGGFTPVAGSPYTTGALPRSIATGDFNGDGRLDIATANYGDGDVTVLLNAIPVVPAMVSAASYLTTAAVAPSSIVSIFGIGLATATAAAQLPAVSAGQPLPATPALPATLGNATAYVTDVTGAQSPLTFFYVSPTQINALMPPAVAMGAATFTVLTPAGSQKSTVTVNSTAPSIFTANGTGKGVAAAQFIQNIVSPNPPTPVYTCLATLKPPNACVPQGLDVSGGASVLVLYGTGIRNRLALSAVTVTVNGTSLAPSYAGPAPGSWGEDQINVSLPPALVHTGVVNVTVSVNNTMSNVVTLDFL